MKKYFSLVLFAHTIFALPFAIIGFFLAVTTTENHFNWLKLVFMLLCMVFARNSAMAFNRYLDRDIDAINPRTKLRDIPAGRISAASALNFYHYQLHTFYHHYLFHQPALLLSFAGRP